MPRPKLNLTENQRAERLREQKRAWKKKHKNDPEYIEKRRVYERAYNKKRGYKKRKKRVVTQEQRVARNEKQRMRRATDPIYRERRRGQERQSKLRNGRSTRRRGGDRSNEYESNRARWAKYTSDYNWRRKRNERAMQSHRDLRAHINFMQMLEIASLICKLSKEDEPMKPKTTHEHID